MQPVEHQEKFVQHLHIPELLDPIAQEIAQLHWEGLSYAQRSVQSIISVGRLLIAERAKRKRRGDWEEWIEFAFTDKQGIRLISRRTIYNYIAAAENISRNGCLLEDGRALTDLYRTRLAPDLAAELGVESIIRPRPGGGNRRGIKLQDPAGRQLEFSFSVLEYETKALANRDCAPLREIPRPRLAAWVDAMEKAIATAREILAEPIEV